MAAPKPSVVDDPAAIFKLITNDGIKELDFDAQHPVDASNAASKENQRAATGEVAKSVLASDDVASSPKV